MTDPRLASQVDGQWNNNFLCTMMPEVMSCLRGDLAKFSPEFILATGDISSKQTRDAMFEARDLMDSLDLPYYPMGGNHDFVYEASRDWFLEAFKEHLPTENTYYSFTHNNLHFCVLDAWLMWNDGTLSPVSQGTVDDTVKYSVMGPWALPPHQLEWLEQDLKDHEGIPTIIANHYPAVPIPNRLIRPGTKDAGHLSNGQVLLDLTSRFPQVRAFLQATYT